MHSGEALHAVVVRHAQAEAVSLRRDRQAVEWLRHALAEDLPSIAVRR